MIPSRKWRQWPGGRISDPMVIISDHKRVGQDSAGARARTPPIWPGSAPPARAVSDGQGAKRRSFTRALPGRTIRSTPTSPRAVT